MMQAMLEKMLKDLAEHLEKDEKEIQYRKKVLKEWKQKIRKVKK